MLRLILLAMIAVFKIGPPGADSLVAAAYLPPFFLTLGCTYILSVQGIFFRDTGQMTSILSQMPFFMPPIFYPPDVVPGWLKPIFMFNLLARVVEFFRQTLLWGGGFSGGHGSL